MWFPTCPCAICAYYKRRGAPPFIPGPPPPEPVTTRAEEAIVNESPDN